MKSTKNVLIAVLLVLVGATGALALHEYRQVARLKAQILADDAAGLRKRVAELEKQNRRLAAELAARSGQDADEANAGGPPGDQGGGRRGRFGGFQQLLNNPQFQKLMAIQAKTRLDARYAALFKSLNLSPDQLDQLKNLLVQRQQAQMDAATAAMQQGISPRSDPEAFRQAIADAETAVDQQIQAQLGSTNYATYQQYEQTMPERNTVTQVQQALSYTSTPLTDEQTAQLVQILQQTSAQSGGGGFGMFGGGGGGNQTALITSQALTLAEGILSAPQLQALQQVQQAQQAQQQMQQLMRASRQGQGGG